MFIDKAKIKIKAGNGGNGAKTFYSSKLVNLGGPDGGDGGRGGDVLFRADGSMSTLLDFKYKSSYFAGDGGKGEQQNRTGKNGANMAIRVPCGTVVKDLDGDVIADLLNDGEEKVVLRGGSGGHGNKYYATSTRRAPNFSQLGETTEAHAVILELKTIADAGLIGFPSVGKSLILSKVSDARPKVADYHFTTLSPNLGVVRYYGDSFVVADIPGLIEGAAQGAGLGFEFLRHIERVRLLLHVVDISGGEGRDPYEDYLAVRKELKSYGNVLAKLPEIIVFNKCDLLPYDGNSQ
ncbi:MAG: GTPase ObgE, partial [Clostridiales bacterium]|nr:GTPase ObgE [Clostridiales bacterium]